MGSLNTTGAGAGWWEGLSLKKRLAFVRVGLGRDCGGGQYLEEGLDVGMG